MHSLPFLLAVKKTIFRLGLRLTPACCLVPLTPIPEALSARLASKHRWQYGGCGCGETAGVMEDHCQSLPHTDYLFFYFKLQVGCRSNVLGYNLPPRRPWMRADLQQITRISSWVTFGDSGTTLHLPEEPGAERNYIYFH